MSRTIVGILVGIVIGVVFVWLGALNAFFVALIILAGYLLGKIFSGDIDLLDLYGRLSSGQGQRRR